MKALGAVAFAVVMAFLGGVLGYIFALNGQTYDIIGAGNGNAFVLNRLSGNLRLCTPTKCSPVPVESR